MNELDFKLSHLQRWLAEQTGEQFENQSTISVKAMRGGGSCEMFEMHSHGERWAIRRAPVSAVSATAHNVIREYRIIKALQGRGARVPELLAACDDKTVMGTPFYVMRYVDGEVIRRSLPDRYRESPQTQPRIGEELIDALVELHAVDWRGTVLEEISKPENFLCRQVERWMSQLQGYRNRDMPGVDAVAEWLTDNQPLTGDLTIMHGDYKIDNAIYSKGLPPKILTLVDFEMTTVGDPLIDLAWAMIFWPEDGNLIAIAAPGSERGMDAAYCQPPQCLIDRYAERSGRNVDNFQWYEAFAAWKLAIVLEASYVKFLQGESKNPNHEFFGFLVDQLLQRASRFAR